MRKSYKRWTVEERGQFAKILATAKTAREAYTEMRKAFPTRTDGSLSAEIDRRWKNNRKKPDVVRWLYSLLWRKRSAAMKAREMANAAQATFSFDKVADVTEIDKEIKKKYKVVETDVGAPLKNGEIDTQNFLTVLGKLEDLTHNAASLHIMNAETASEVLRACETLQAFFTNALKLP